ncbi:MAG: DedA family protein [Actinomycetota bacterium]|nr:DedA family protein [Actinomycetota bacterium]
MLASVADRIVEYFLPLFSSWGYLLVFGGVFLESIFLTGWIAPGTTVLLLGSFYAALGELNIFLVAAVAVVGAFLGDNLGYLMSLKGGDWLLERYGHHINLKRGLKKTERYFSRYGGATVLFGRLMSGVDAFIPLAAGIGSMSYKRYISYDIPGIFIWTGIMVSVGYLFGEHWEAIDDFVGYFGWGLLGLLLTIAAIVYLVNRWRGDRQLTS